MTQLNESKITDIK